jgi:hypothetical protein
MKKEEPMKKFRFPSMPIAALAATLAVAGAQTLVLAPSNTAVVTASNTAKNQLLVYNTSGALVQTVSTQGKGGASGNAGGIAAKDNIVAAVNFGSQNVSIFERGAYGFQMTQLVPALSSPLSVAFGADHLYILGAIKVESHVMVGPYVDSSPDGAAELVHADGSSAQVGVLSNPSQLVIAEKSNMIETVNLRSDGAVMGAATPVANIPANVNVPFGLITRGNDAYVTIAHANEISLVRGGAVLTVTGSGTQMAPCWLALKGPFLFSSNSPSMSISRYAVYGQKIVQDAAVAAALDGDPTDIAIQDGLLAVIDGNGPLSHLSMFSIDEDGNLTLLQTADIIHAPVNGVAIVTPETTTVPPPGS